MHYAAYISREGDNVLAEFPDCPGCQTFAESGDALADAAREALEGWLEAHLVDGQVPPRPVSRTGAPRNTKVAQISVRARLAAALQVRWARHERGLSQRELGDLASVRQQQINKLEDPDQNPTLETLEKVARALGVELDVGFEPVQRISLPAPAPSRMKRKR